MSSSNEEWPSLVAESRQLLFESILVYGFPDLHALAHKKLLQEGDAAKVNLPIKTKDFLDVVMKNKAALEKHFGPRDSKLYGTALFLAREAINKLDDGNRDALLKSELLVFDDKHSKSELVYGISKSDATKRVIVCFRGTATLKDLEIDAEGHLVDCDNPINPNSKEKLGVHQGFHKYLNGAPKGRNGGKDLDEVSKYSEIMSQLSMIFHQYPDYRLYVTGHSLGASLAQLFAMEAAASKDEFITKPVTTINFASPKVGDIYFRDCFESLEDAGKLRCLRFCNDTDIIPTLPDRENCSCLRTLRCRPSVYRHAGPRIILYPGGKFEIRYEKRDKETKWKFVEEARWTRTHGVGFAMMVPTLLRYSKDFLTYHSCEEYMKRFTKFQSKGGDSVYLNDIYKNEAALTKLLEEGFKQS